MQIDPRRHRTGLFGSPRETYGTPGIGDGIEQHRWGDMAAEAPKKKKGLFGSGIMLGDVIGIAGDAVAINRGMTPMFAAAETERRKQAAELAAEQRKRSMERDDKRWEWENKPKDPYRWRNNNGDLMEMGPDGAPRVAYDDPKDRMEWMQVRDPLTGELRIIPQGGTAPPDTLPPDFDFGGGGAGNGPGTFPGY